MFQPKNKKKVKGIDNNKVVKKNKISFVKYLSDISDVNFLPRVFTVFHQQIFLLILAGLLYANTLQNKYVLDDVISITQNSFVQKGIGGIKDILKHDSMYGYVGYQTELEGGRYRPVPLIIFAVEHELWGNNPLMGHLMNIIYWLILVYALMYLFYNYLFSNNKDFAFLSTLLFIIHPIHTEVIANIKSRDEILSLIFLTSSLIWLFKYLVENNNLRYIVLSLLLYFLGLLSKEYGVTYLMIIPLTLYVFTNLSNKNIVKITVYFVVIFVVYFMLRYSIVGLNFDKKSTELLNNPFLYASFWEKYATIMLCLLKYLKLSFIPYPLSYDYRFNEIPITDFSNVYVLFSVLLHSLLVIYMIFLLKKRHVLSYFIFYYLISIFISSNILVDIGALMGERFLFQPSVGFSMAMAYILLLPYKLNINKNILRFLLLSFLITIVFVGGFYIVERNKAWSSEITLYLEDAKVVKNSAPAQNSAGSSLINLGDYIGNYADSLLKNKWNADIYVKEWNYYLKLATKYCSKIKEDSINKILFDIKMNDYNGVNNKITYVTNSLYWESIEYTKKAIAIHPLYHDAFVNLIIGYIRTGTLDTAEVVLNKLDNLNKRIVGLKVERIEELRDYLASQYHLKAQRLTNNGKLAEALFYYRKAAEVKPNKDLYWYDYGGASYTLKDYKTAIYAWGNCLEINPQHKEARLGYDILKKSMININK